MLCYVAVYVELRHYVIFKPYLKPLDLNSPQLIQACLMQRISRKVNKQSVLVHILHGLYRRILLFVSTSLLVFGVWGLAFRVWHIYPKHRLDSSYKASRTSVGLRRLYTTTMLVCTQEKYHASWYFVRYISGFNVPRLLILCGCCPVPAARSATLPTSSAACCGQPRFTA